MDENATTVKDVSKAFMRLIRDNMFGGKELALIEPLNGPRPGVLHCTIGFIRARSLQNEVYDYEWDEAEDENIEYLRGERYCQYRVTFFGVGAYQKAVDCQNLLRSNIGTFGIAPITGFGGVGEVQQATTEYLGHQEERAFFNIEVYANLSAAYAASYIETVQGDIVREGEPYPYEVTVIQQ